VHLFQNPLFAPQQLQAQALLGLLGFATPPQIVGVPFNQNLAFIRRPEERIERVERRREEEFEPFHRRIGELERTLREFHERLEMTRREHEMTRRQLAEHRERVQRVEEMHRGLRREFETERGRPGGREFRMGRR
jgi:septal ring factor EnvC (AmiA/AmiB activator)